MSASRSKGTVVRKQALSGKGAICLVSSAFGVVLYEQGTGKGTAELITSRRLLSCESREAGRTVRMLWVSPSLCSCCSRAAGRRGGRSWRHLQACALPLRCPAGTFSGPPEAAARALPGTVGRHRAARQLGAGSETAPCARGQVSTSFRHLPGDLHAHFSRREGELLAAVLHVGRRGRNRSLLCFVASLAQGLAPSSRPWAAGVLPCLALRPLARFTYVQMDRKQASKLTCFNASSVCHRLARRPIRAPTRQTPWVRSTCRSVALLGVPKLRRGRAPGTPSPCCELNYFLSPCGYQSFVKGWPVRERGYGEGTARLGLSLPTVG